MSDVQNVKTRILNLKADYNSRLNALNKRLEASHFEGERELVKKDIEQLSSAYGKAFERAEIALKAAEEEEKAYLAKEEAARVGKELEVKGKALKEWQRAGGDPSVFEAAWPTMRNAILNEQVISSLTGRDKAEQPKSKPFTL